MKKFIKYPDKEIFTYCYIKTQHVGWNIWMQQVEVYSVLILKK